MLARALKVFLVAGGEYTLAKDAVYFSNFK